MLSSLIIVFREILEAALIIGILLAATRGLCRRGRFVFFGCLAGVIGACVVAVFTEAISGAIEGMGQELFNAAILILAAIMISWHVVWMKQHAAEMSKELKQVGQNVCEGKAPLYALSTVAFVAVLREGSEIVLFLYGLLASGKDWMGVASGGVFGLILGGLVGVLLYLGLLRIPMGSLFSVTGIILIFLTAGMVSQAVGYLSAVGWLPTLVDPIWDMSKVLSEHSIPGKILNALVGYTERPTGIQAIFYALTVGGLVMLLKWVGAPSKKSQVAMLLVVATGLLGWGGEAHATKKVYSPLVEYGELEIEYRGAYTFDDRASKDGRERHKVAVGYGVTPWWFTEVYGAWQDTPADGKGLEYEATEWENKFQISQAGEWFVDTGAMVELEFASEDDAQDEVKLLLLLEKEMDLFRHRLNPFVEYKYGTDEDDEWEAGASWSTTYRFRKEFEPGVEIHWNHGNVEESKSFDEQDLQLGPVVYGKIGDRIKYDVGYLFGVSENAPDGELKWIFEFEHRF